MFTSLPGGADTSLPTSGPLHPLSPPGPLRPSLWPTASSVPDHTPSLEPGNWASVFPDSVLPLPVLKPLPCYDGFGPDSMD